jgi:hypothetical protein
VTVTDESTELNQQITGHQIPIVEANVANAKRHSFLDWIIAESAQAARFFKQSWTATPDGSRRFRYKVSDIWLTPNG